MAGMALAVCCFLQGSVYSAASGGTVTGFTSTSSESGEYTIIRIHAEDDSGGPLQYAIDSDKPEAFGSSNEFAVEKGSEHTVYVKDSAGNISAQVYRVPDADVDMEINIGYSDTSSMAQITDEERKAIESGGGTMAEKVVTDGSTDSERLFYTVTTKEGHVFYLVIDQGNNSDNVYLLDQVTDSDLYALAAEGEEPDKKEDTGSVFDTGRDEKPAGTETGNTDTKEKEGKEKGGGDTFFILLIILLAAAAFYYYKIYKPKQEKMNAVADAKDMDEFEAEDEEEDGNDILDFSVSKEERDATMAAILNSSDFEDDTAEEELLNYDPDSDSEWMQDTEEESVPEEAEEPEDGISQLEIEEEEDE